MVPLLVLIRALTAVLGRAVMVAACSTSPASRPGAAQRQPWSSKDTLMPAITLVSGFQNAGGSR